MRELNDLLGLIAVLLQFGGVGAVSVRAYLLRRRQTRCQAVGWSGVLILLTGLWLALNSFDVGSVWGAIGNDLKDIPLATTLRIAVFSAWLWVLQGVLTRLAKEELK
ncbi:hypothetical protein [Deinococcus fonticola]|uniref:hypothetical protein n=1 Tax=Deinococcus fonticola TaxID=2528713 RepID=UPI001074E24F|nr:hypothetical protein [Deinococcus fonticola]